MFSRTLLISGILVMLVIAGASTFFTRNLPAQITYFYLDDPNYPNQDAYTRCTNSRTTGTECCYEGSAYMLMNKCTLAGAAVDTSALGNYYPSAPNGQPGDSCGYLDSYPCCPGSSMMPVQDPNSSWGFKYCYGQTSGYGSRYYCVNGAQEIMPSYGGSNSSLAGKNGVCKYECEASYAGVPGAPPQCKWKDGTAVTSMPGSPGINERCAMQQTPCCPGPSTTSPILSGGGTTPNDIMCQNNYYCDYVTGRCKDPYGTCGNGEVEGSEMCDLGPNGYTGDSYSNNSYPTQPQNPAANCTTMCTLRCSNGTCDANECSTNTDPNALYCAGDCSAVGHCGDGCDNDTDALKNSQDPGCYTWDPVYVEGRQDTVAQLLTTGGNEGGNCPKPSGIPFDGPVGYEVWRSNGDNMCKPAFDFGICEPEEGDSQSSPVDGGYVRWSSIEACCRAQANWVVDYLCDNSNDPAKTAEMSMGKKAFPLCNEQVKEAVREEFVAVCACQNAAAVESATNSPKAEAITALRNCEQRVCPDDCAAGGGDWKKCGGCLGYGGGAGNSTKADVCRTEAIMQCIPVQNDAAGGSGSSSQGPGSSRISASSTSASRISVPSTSSSSPKSSVTTSSAGNAGSSMSQPIVSSVSSASSPMVSAFGTSAVSSASPSSVALSSTSRSSSVPMSSQRSSTSPSFTRSSSSTSKSSSVPTTLLSSSSPSSSSVTSSRSSSSSSTSIIVDVSSSSRSSSSRTSVAHSVVSLGSSAQSAATSINNIRSFASAASITRIVLSEALAACGGNECGLGGSQFCALTNQTCQQTSDLPCIRCIGASSAASAIALRCSGQECAMGGSEFCALSGETCVADGDSAQCFRCAVASSVSSVALASSAPSAPSASSARPTIELADLPAFCGNGITEEDEQCDDGEKNSNNPNTCRTNCTLSRCGDGIIDIPLEACDDGNMRSNDGCSQTCQLERTKTETLPAQVIELPTQQINQPTPVDVAYEPLPTTRNPQPATIVHAAPPANPDTGPAALAVMISGAAAGYAYMKRRKL